MELLVIFIQHLEYVQLTAARESISDFIQLLDYVFALNFKVLVIHIHHMEYSIIL